MVSVSTKAKKASRVEAGFLLVCLLFFASGFSSLIYQVVWTRLLVLVFGSTTFATSTVLAVFMGGLALGSWLAGHATEKIKRPFLWYGILEGVIGIWALFVPEMFDQAIPIYRAIWALFHVDQLTFGLVRFLVACVILIVPTTCMGATLPLLSKFVAESLEHLGERVGTIYAINTLGAVFGAGLAGFILLPSCGFTLTTLLAAGINIVLLLAVLRASPVLERARSNRMSDPQGKARASEASSAHAATPEPPAKAEAEPISFAPPVLESEDNDMSAESTMPSRHTGKKEKKAAKRARRAAMHQLARQQEIAIDGGASETGKSINPVRPAIGPQPGGENQLWDSYSAKAASSRMDASSERIQPAVMFAIFAFSVSGAVAMIYEVCWTRMLSMIIGSSTYAFSIMLATFLIGIFGGSFICSRFVDRLKEPLVWFGMGQLLISLGCLVSMHLLNLVPWWNLQVNAMFPRDPYFTLCVRFAIAAVILLPLTLNLGMVFPLVVRACTKNLEHLGKSVGTVYSANTIGAIIGSVAAGFVLVPLFGVERTLMISSGVNIALAVGLFFFSRSIGREARAITCLLALLAISACLMRPSIWNLDIFLLTQAERRILRQEDLIYTSLEHWILNMRQQSEIIYWKEGPCSSVAVMYWNRSKNVLQKDGVFSLFTNGCVDASDGHDMSQQVMLSVFPMLWKPVVNTCAIIGWGCGVSTGCILDFPVRQITAIELEPAVIEASKFFHRTNKKPEENARVKIEANDGRNYMLATEKTFDMIISEPSNPWQVGVCNLFTDEYFEICKRRLNPGGTFTLWMQIAEIPPENMRSIFAALRRHFKYCLPLASDDFNLIILASDNPLPAPWAHIKNSFKIPAVARELKEVNIPTPETVLSRIMATPAGITHMSQGVQPNVDDTNKLEFAVGLTYENNTYVLKNAILLAEHMGDPARNVDWGPISDEEKATTMAKVAQEALKFGRPLMAYDWARASQKAFPNETARKMIEDLESVDKKPKVDEKKSRPREGR